MDNHNRSLIGSRLGKYEIQAELGRGGMGTVYRGYDPLLQRYVAVKVLAPHLVWERDFVDRFLREARAAAQIRHPNIVVIHDVGHEGDWYYFVMEYLEGQMLTDLIRKRGPLPLPEVLAVLRPLAGALDYAGRRGLVHRDVKPGNVMIDPSGHVTLTDFGIVQAAGGTRLTGTGVAIGTPAYMSPEQFRGGQVDARSDQYSLAIMAYEMLAGHVPFQADSTLALLHKVVYEPPPPLRGARPDLPSHVQQALERALAKEAGQRYASSGEFVDALSAAADAALAPQVLPEALPARPQPVSPVPPARTELRPGPPQSPAPRPAPHAVPATPPMYRPATRRRPSGCLWLAGVGAVLVLALVVVGILIASSIDLGQGSAPDIAATLQADLATLNAQTATPGEFPTDAPSATQDVPPTDAAPPAGTLPPAATVPPSRAEMEDALLKTLTYRAGNGRVIFADRVQVPPTIDAMLGDWSGPTYDLAYLVYDQDGSWSGPGDLSGRFHLAWDLDHLYLGVEVFDDVHVQTQTGALIYRGDDVEIQVDADLPGDFSEAALNSDDGQVGLSAGDFATLPPEAYIWRPPDIEQPGTAIALAAQPTGSGYVLEAAIPWWALGGRPPLETATGFALNLTDNDVPGTAQQQSMVSTAPGRAWGDPTSWGTLVLVDW